VFNGLSITLAGTEAEQAQSVTALKALPQVGISSCDTLFMMSVMLNFEQQALQAPDPVQRSQEHTPTRR